MAEQCPICLNPADRVRDRDYGDKTQFRCTRCGPFEISGTALAMLRGRIQQDPLARARLSHAVRSNTSEANWLLINSTNLDEFARQPLPSIPQQMDILVRWISSKLHDNRFGRVARPDPESLAGIVGVADAAGAVRLVEYAKKQGLVEIDITTGELGLSPEGWDMTDPVKKKEGASRVPLTTPLSQEVVKANCNQCSGDRKAYVRASHTVHDGDGEVSWSDTYSVLECCGCGGVSVRHEFWFSEWDQVDNHPITGEPRLVPGIKVTSWPPPTKRKKPEWADELDDDVLRTVIDEVYQAMNSGLIILASVGTRTLLDRAMFLRVQDPRGGFAAKLNLMVERGHIGKDERDILEAITDAGSAAAHRGFAPPAKTLATIVETVENFLHREFVLKTAAGDVRASTPPRPPRDRS